jgi:TPR repeat protein
MAAAQCNLGTLHQFGWAVTQDYAEAVRWYRRAAHQGFAPAQHNLGAMYHNGDRNLLLRETPERDFLGPDVGDVMDTPHTFSAPEAFARHSMTAGNRLGSSSQPTRGAARHSV